MNYIAVVDCQRCGKTGALTVSSNSSLVMTLHGKWVDGFILTKIGDKDLIICEGCYQDWEAFESKQSRERKEFINA